MKQFDLGVIVGRFQTLHLGHESLINMGISLCDRLAVFVGSSQEHGTIKNPFDITTREKMLKEVYGDQIMIFGLPDRKDYGDDPGWGKYLLENIDRVFYKAPELMLYGNDQCRSSWFNPEDIKDTSEFIINRGRIPLSGTKVRDLMLQDKRREWMSCVNPKLHKMYDELRRELLAAYEKHEDTDLKNFIEEQNWE